MEGKTTIEKLMERGKATGELTTKEISDALEELDFDVEKVDKLYDTLEGLNIEIIEDLEPDIEHHSGVCRFGGGRSTSRRWGEYRRPG